MLEQQVVAVAVADVGQLDDRVAEARHLHEVGERQLVGAGRLGRPAVDHGPRRGDLRPGLAGAGGRAPPQPRQLGAGQVAALALGRRLALGPLGPGVEVGGVAAVVDVGGPAVELEDPGRHPVEHVAVVGDEDEAAGEGGEPLLQPRDRVEVEVVGRLVEHEQVALGAVTERHQRPGEGHPLRLPAREAAHVGIDQVGDPEAVEHRLGLPPAADRGADGAVGQHRHLVERDHAGAPTPAHDARLGLDRPGQDPEQRRLARAVDADDRQPVAARHGHRQVGEQRLTGPAHRHALGVHEDHGPTVPAAAPAAARPDDGFPQLFRGPRPPKQLWKRGVEGIPEGRCRRRYVRPPMPGSDGILSGPLDIDGPRRRPSTYPSVEGTKGLEVLHRPTGVEGTVIGFEHGGVAIHDRHTGTRRLVRLDPGAFRVRGRAVSLVPPRPARAPAPARRTASGSTAVRTERARVARASRILVEGVHDAELVEKVWGDDLRVEGVVVERLDGMDDLAAVVDAFRPGPGRRLGVLLDHLVAGTKEARVAAAVRHPHVLVTGTPYVDVWQAVRPRAAGIDAWPVVPMGEPWKEGVIARLGVRATPGEFWRMLLGKVTSFADLDPALVGAVEQLIDFVTTPDA